MCKVYHFKNRGQHQCLFSKIQLFPRILKFVSNIKPTLNCQIVLLLKHILKFVSRNLNSDLATSVQTSPSKCGSKNHQFKSINHLFRSSNQEFRSTNQSVQIQQPSIWMQYPINPDLVTFCLDLGINQSDLATFNLDLVTNQSRPSNLQFTSSNLQFGFSHQGVRSSKQQSWGGINNFSQR